MKSQEMEMLNKEYNNSFCNSELTTIKHLEHFIDITDSSSLPVGIKNRLKETANRDIKSISALMDLELETHLEQVRELSENDN